MKSTLLIANALVVLATPLWAELDVPKKVFRMEQLDEAKAKAKAENKALSIIYTDSQTTCPLCNTSVAQAFKEFGSYSVMVLTESKKDEDTKLPPPVLTSLHAAKMGNTIPKFVITSPDGNQVWGATSYDLLKKGDARKIYRETENSAKAKLANPPTAGAEDSGKQVLDWSHQNGSRWRGAFVRLTDSALVIRLAGEESTGEGNIPLAQLAPASLAYARFLAQAQSETSKAAADSGASAVPDVLIWKNAAGRTLEAKFVKLDGDRLTVETAAGQSHTLILPQLDPASQAQARKFAQP